MTEQDDWTDEVSQYYAARASVYDETAGYTDLAAEQLRAHIKSRYQEILAGHVVLEIACGTGYWTEVIGEAANSVLAIDIHQSLISQAEERCARLPHVRFQVADAYTLNGVPAGFTAASGHWWWSHMPREKIPGFLRALHSKLVPGALVLFADQLRYEWSARRQDAGGNNLETRTLPDGRSFEIVKNFPAEAELVNALQGIADNIKYIEHPDEQSWDLTYNTRQSALLQEQL